MKLWELYILVNQVCPIHSINSDGKCSFKDGVTNQEKFAAQAIIDEHLPNLEND